MNGSPFTAAEERSYELVGRCQMGPVHDTAERTPFGRNKGAVNGSTASPRRPASEGICPAGSSEADQEDKCGQGRERHPDHRRPRAIEKDHAMLSGRG